MALPLSRSMLNPSLPPSIKGRCSSLGPLQLFTSTLRREDAVPKAGSGIRSPHTMGTTAAPVALLLLLLPLSVLLLGLSPACAARQPDSTILQVTDPSTATGATADENALPGWAWRHEGAFRSFMAQYGKQYGSRKEYLHRLVVFARNVARAAEHQALDPTAKHGVTPFSDLTAEEFQAAFTGLVVPEGGHSGPATNNGAAGGGDRLEMLDTDGLPDEFDWREKGAVTKVKTQGHCGACWAFSTTGAVEGAHFLSTGRLVSLSEQQLVDCDSACDAKDKDACDKDCHGGLMTNAYNYLMTAGGLESESEYPYTAKKGKCRFNKTKIAVKVTNFTKVPLDEAQMAAYLVRRGPLAIGLNAAFMQTYVGGVSCPIVCFRKMVNHGVLLVGYGSKGYSILRLGNVPYWIIKNSWGEKWGEKGYYRLCKGHNVCGINSMVSAVTAVA